MVTNMVIYLDLDTVTEMRTIYGVFDFLGDVGGLLDLLQLFAGMLVQFFAWLFGSNLNFFLIENLFKRDQKRKPELSFNRESDPVLEQVRQRSQARITRCNIFLRDHKSALMSRKGTKSIEKELDIVRFIRRQKMYEVALKTLFTRLDLFLIKN